MRKGLTEIVFILDRSGSMSGLESDTIGGYNAMLGKQKTEDGEAVISTVLFNDRREILHDRMNLRQVDPISDREYRVGGSTALLDAVGSAIRHIGKVQKELPEEEKPEKTLFIITTDGMENSSTRYSYEKVRKMVEKKKEKKNWEFIFLGANIDAIQVAGRFGVAASRAVRYENDCLGAELNYEAISCMISCARGAGSAEKMSEAMDHCDALESIREDYEELQSIPDSRGKREKVTEKEKKRIAASMADLGERQRDMARLLFGLDGESVHTYDEVAKKYRVTPERMHQMAARIKRIAGHRGHGDGVSGSSGGQ